MNENTDKSEFTDINLSNINKITPNNEDITVKVKNQRKSRIRILLRIILNFITIEPFLLCYMLPSVVYALTVQNLNLEKACRVNLNQTDEVCHQVIYGGSNYDIDNIDKYTAISEAAQKLVADMTAWKQPLQSGIPAIVILFVGAWSDKTGNRKALMLIPILGEIITSIGLLLTTYFLVEWPLWITACIEAVPLAFTGGFSIALMGSYSFIADATSVDSRTFRIGIVAVIVTLGTPLSSVVSDVLSENIGYYGIFSIGLVLYILGFIYTYYKIHDVRRIDPEKGFQLKGFFHPKNVLDTLSIVVRRKDGKLLQIWLIIVAHIVILGPVFGEGAVLYYYTLIKYKMDYMEYSLFSTFSVLVGLIGTLIAVTVFSKSLKMHDSMIGVIATACKVLSSFFYGLAPTKEWYYCGPIIDIFGNAGVTAIRSLGTKFVKADEVGKMCSIIGFVEALEPVIYTPLYSLVYSNTLATFIGAFYILGGVMTIPAFFIFIYMYVLHKKHDRDVVNNPNPKEMYARDNEITSENL